MADTVRYIMEDMVPELEDMVKQRYFTRAEVKQIVKRREGFEYLLKRRAALKEDYLRYIEYESKLEELRHHRMKALLPGGKKSTLADYAIVRRIHFIFERAVRKFKTDLSLWTAWLEFCRASNSNRRLGRVVGRALQIHPTEPGLWVYAAAWEFEHNGNSNAARALMQQGLRLCKYSEKMWLDYFDMELMYVEKLVARRRIMGLGVPEPDTGQQQQQQQSDPAAAAAESVGKKRQRSQILTDAGGGSSTGDDSDNQRNDGEGPLEAQETAAAQAEALENYLHKQQQEEQQQGSQVPNGSALDPQAAVKAVLNGAVARLVFQNAIKAANKHSTANGTVSSSNYLAAQPSRISTGSSSSSNRGLAFRAGFLGVLQRYKSPGVGLLRREVLDSIRRDFAQDPDAADLLARAACDPSDASAPNEQLQAAVNEYERLLSCSSVQTAVEVASSRSSKRRRTGSAANGVAESLGQVAEQQQQQQQQQQAVQPLPQVLAGQLYRLYSGYLTERLQALMSHEENVMAAAACAQQLFRVLAKAHDANAVGEELYVNWVKLAQQLNQHKVARKAARLACEAYPISAAVWDARVRLEAHTAQHKAAGSSRDSQQQQQLLAVIKQGLQKVPAAEAEPLWQQAFELYSNSPVQLEELQQLLLSAVTRAAVKGPFRGGLGAVAGRCLAAVWHTTGAAGARQLWKRLLLLPPAGGDMFRSMIELETQKAAASGKSKQQQQQQGLHEQQQVQEVSLLPVDALKRARAIYDAWAHAYGSDDVDLWVHYALFEQGQRQLGPGRVYWRAVKALQEPDEFIQLYRSKVGLI